MFDPTMARTHDISQSSRAGQPLHHRGDNVVQLWRTTPPISTIKEPRGLVRIILLGFHFFEMQSKDR